MTVDHLVIGAASLAQAAAWCREQLGCEPAPGGRHALMGTHNLLLNLSSAAQPRCYLEFIAIDPEAAPVARRRWFGLDEPAVQASLQQTPRLRRAATTSAPPAPRRCAMAGTRANRRPPRAVISAGRSRCAPTACRKAAAAGRR